MKKSLNKFEVLKEYKEMLTHNLLAYSFDYLMIKPKKQYVKEWEETQEKISLVEEMMEDNKQIIKKEVSNISFSKDQILSMYPNMQYYVKNSNGGLLAGTVELDDAIKFAEKYKKEYLQDKLNNHLGVYVYDNAGKNLYVAKGKDLENEETEEFE